MATVTRGKTFISGETVEPGDMHQLVDAATVTNIVDADIASNAGIASTKLSAAVQQSLQAFVPAGAVMPFAMNSAPSGWLAANGDAVSRSTYAALFAAIGTTHGAGDGSTTFNLPDLRGIFVRGSGSQTVDGTAYSGTFAAKQKDALISHTHTITDTSTATTFSSTSTLQSFQTVSGSLTRTTATQSPAGESETRPANIALLYCIKH